MNYISSAKGQYEIADGVYRGILSSLKEIDRRKSKA
jgi:hypothetical protein